MVAWAQSIDLTDAFIDFHNGDRDCHSLANHIAETLDTLPKYANDYVELKRKRLIADLRDLPEDVDVDELDEILEDLYNWGDSDIGFKKACWIKVI